MSKRGAGGKPKFGKAKPAEQKAPPAELPGRIEKAAVPVVPVQQAGAVAQGNTTTASPARNTPPKPNDAKTIAAPAGPTITAETMPQRPTTTPPPMAQRPTISPPPAPAVEAKPLPAPQPPAPPPGARAQQPVQEPPTPTPPPPPLPPLLFEIGWEVCWQLGGIYTVLRTKADAMKDQWDDRYCLIGPYNPATAALEFEERPSEGIIRDALDELRDAGIPCHFGRWLVPGRPRVILLDYRARYMRLHEDKYLLWADHGISTVANDGEVNDVVAFGFTVTEFFRALSRLANGRTILAHFHEWMGGVAVPRIAHLKLPIATIFTTHATLLGRYLANGNPDFYNHLPFMNADDEAQRFNIYPRFAIERAATHASTVFTTVSEVTAFESEKLLGRRPDVILPNGLNHRRFAALHEFQNLHRQYKERIHEFVMGHFFPSYSFDLDNTLYFFTSGRYEYRNKGMDLFIEALHRLNERMKQMPAMLPKPTIVAFVITRAQTRNMNVDALRNQSMFNELRNTCLEIQQQMGRKLFLSAVTSRMPTYPELMPDDATVRLKRAIHAWRSGRQPLVVTHDLVDDAGDPILKHVRARGMFNSADDSVKLVFHPDFMSATSPLINLDYEQFVRGCHMGIFPSYYEPWGYTPMESIALGVPAVTTDLSGFGAYVQRQIPEAAEQGVLVLNRRYAGFDQAADQLTEYLFQFVRLNRRQRIELRNKTERLSEMFDWSVLVKHYHEAHNMAIERIGAPKPGRLEVRVV
ncbi:MAG TPA: glycosyltransferase [Tepidisphaeraceae bacterium]